MSASPPAEEGPLAGSPSDFLKNIVGKKVKVKIGSGVDYHGELACSCILEYSSAGKDGRGSADIVGRERLAKYGSMASTQAGAVVRPSGVEGYEQLDLFQYSNSWL
jgi:hypothetical protein